MTVTLDDVVCLLHIPIEGRMLSHNEKVSHAIGVALMTKLVSVSEVVVIKKYGTDMTYSWLRQIYEDHLTLPTNLENPTTREETVERDNCQLWCVRCFLLYICWNVCCSLIKATCTLRWYILRRCGTLAGCMNVMGWTTLAYVYHNLICTTNVVKTIIGGGGIL